MNQYNPDVYKIAMIPKSKEDVEIIYELTNYFKENYK
jgi:3-dehydroquinate dehydratase